jgi:hypothetical protein
LASNQQLGWHACPLFLNLNHTVLGAAQHRHVQCSALHRTKKFSLHRSCTLAVWTWLSARRQCYATLAPALHTDNSRLQRCCCIT